MGKDGKREGGKEGRTGKTGKTGKVVILSAAKNLA